MPKVDNKALSGRDNPVGSLTNRFALKWVASLPCAFLLVVLFLVQSPAEDSDQLRYYLGIRFGESNPASNAHDVVGFSVGANFSRYVGFELSGDFYALFVDTPMFGDVGELGTLALIPQVRVRYPLFNDRLPSYLMSNIMSNIALGFQTGYFISRGHTFQLNDGPVLSGNLDSFLFSFSPSACACSCSNCSSFT